MSLFVNYNGKIISEDTPLFTGDNRAFKYGDALFETIRVFRGEMLFVDKHLQRLKEGLELLKMNDSSKYSVEWLLNEGGKLLNNNKIINNGRIRIAVSRNDGGFYCPSDSSTSFFIEAKTLADDLGFFNAEGLRIGIYTENFRPSHKLSSIKTANSLLSVMSSVFAKENSFDDVLLLNEKGNISEATSSNIFIISGNSIITPSVSEACVAGVMRSVILKILRNQGFELIEGELDVQKLIEADEVFLTNVISGIRWVENFEDKVFANTKTQTIHQALMEQLSH